MFINRKISCMFPTISRLPSKENGFHGNQKFPTLKSRLTKLLLLTLLFQQLIQYDMKYCCTLG